MQMLEDFSNKCQNKRRLLNTFSVFEAVIKKVAQRLIWPVNTDILNNIQGKMSHF